MKKLIAILFKMKNYFLFLLSLLLFLTACKADNTAISRQPGSSLTSAVSATAASNSTASASSQAQSSESVPASASASPAGSLSSSGASSCAESLPAGFLPIEALGEGFAADLENFQQAIAVSANRQGRYYYLYITDETGNPVPNLMGILGINWRDFENDRSGRKDGVSMAGGLLAFRLNASGEATLYLVNNDTGQEPLTLELFFSDEMLQNWKEDEAYHVIWEKPTPADTLTEAQTVIEVQVLDSDENPVPGQLVYFEPYRNPNEEHPAMGEVYPYEPRYTDETGTARFVAEKAVRSVPPLLYGITVKPSPASYYDDGPYKTHVSAAMSDENGDWITRYTVHIPVSSILP